MMTSSRLGEAGLSADLPLPPFEFLLWNLPIRGERWED